jgi:hypothetical protein
MSDSLQPEPSAPKPKRYYVYALNLNCAPLF